MIAIVDPRAVEKQTLSAIGIDLGTTYSLVAVVQDGAAHVLPDEAGRVLLPSVVSYESELPLVGFEALQVVNHLASMKRKIGEDPMAIVVASDILSTLKKRAEDFLNKPVEQAVITVPAYFNEFQRQATKKAAEQAGLQVLRLLSEPTAAAVAYGLANQTRGTHLIYDLGGGTFDVSILRLEKGFFRVIATGGDSHLGGDDVDSLLSAFVKAKQDRTISHFDARFIKEKLSVDAAYEGITREDLEQLMMPLIDRTLAIVKQTLLDAKLRSDEIDSVILVGGSTRMPLVRASVEEFMRKPPLCHRDPDQVVVEGAAWQAGVLSGNSREDLLLLDVNPLSVGLEMMGGIVEKIIERHTPLPAMVTQNFTTYQDNQTGFLLHIVQGERELAKDCRSLSHLELSGLVPKPAGQIRLEVTFQMDADGLLEVTAREPQSGRVIQSVVSPAYGLTDADIEAALKESAKYARIDSEKRKIQERRIEALQLIRCVGQAIDEARLENWFNEPSIVESLTHLQATVSDEAVSLQALKKGIVDLELKSRDWMEERLNRTMLEYLNEHHVKKEN